MIKIAVPVLGQDTTNYIQAVKEAEMTPILISVKNSLPEGRYPEYLDLAEFHVEDFDGLLLPGGVDINPARYGQENTASEDINDALDELQLTVLDAFVKARKPVLGICKGHQLINVYFGGTLIQDIPTAPAHSRMGSDVDKRHFVEAGQDSWIAAVYGKRVFTNSSHHQAIGRLGNGLVIAAVCPDDQVPEAIIHETIPVFGVQWHPERMCLKYADAELADGLRIFRFFRGICEIC